MTYKGQSESNTQFFIKPYQILLLELFLHLRKYCQCINNLLSFSIHCYVDNPSIYVKDKIHYYMFSKNDGGYSIISPKLF